MNDGKEIGDKYKLNEVAPYENNLESQYLPVIKRLDPDSTLSDKLSTKTLPVGVTTWTAPSMSNHIMHKNGTTNVENSVNYTHLDTCKFNVISLTKAISGPRRFTISHT